MATICTDAPAKINLTLDVLGRRVDGYHELHSLVIGVGLYDYLRAKLTNTEEIRIVCDQPGIAPRENLACRAAKSLQKKNRVPLGAELVLKKRIPLAAGLGGGSSDAAAALRLCNELWECKQTDVELAALGATLGSDVPLFFRLPSALITGRGEFVAPVRLNWTGWALLICPGLAVRTTDVYAVWQRDDAQTQVGRHDEAILSAKRASDLSGLLSNQLEAAAFRACPELAELADRVDRHGIGPVHMTGSGAVLYRLFDDADEASRAGQRIQNELHVATFVAKAPVCIPPLVHEEF